MEQEQVPAHWPSEYVYTRRSFSSELHPALFSALLSTGKVEDVEKVSPLIAQGRVHADLQVKKITPHLHYLGPCPHPLAHKKYGKRSQYGLFAEREVRERVELGEYVGEQYVMGQGWKKQLKDCDHAWTLDLGPFVLVVNAKKYANEMAFANDYRGLAEGPNTRAKWVVHRGIYHILYETLRKVKRGEELLIDYGEGYWKAAHRSSILPK